MKGLPNVTAKFMDIALQSSTANVHCPISERQVTAGQSKRIVFPGGQATWWHCPVCQGWHLITLTEKETGGSIHNLEVG